MNHFPNIGKRNSGKFVVAVSLIFFLSANFSHAFIGPGSQSAGSGGGLFTVDSNRNIGFGVSSASPTGTFDDNSTGHGYVFMVASSTNPGLALKNLTSNNTYIWSARNVGRLDLYRESASLPGKIIMSISEYGYVGISAPPATSTSRLVVGEGNIKVLQGFFAGDLAGSVAATNVSAGVFGGGTGNFAFPAALAVGTSTTGGLPTKGLYVDGNVGIGTLSPAGKLDVDGIIAVDTNGAIGDTSYVKFVGARAFLGYDGARQSAYIGGRSAKGIVFDTDGDNERMRITSAGKVGIGTTDPGEKLEVAGKVKITGTGNGIVFPDGTTQTTAGGGAEGWLRNATSGYVYLATSTDYVGIGTTNPLWKTHIVNTNAGGKSIPLTLHNQTDVNESETALRFVNRSTSLTSEAYRIGELSLNARSGYPDFILRLSDGAALNDRFVVRGQTGNVGVATTTPNERLVISGTDTGLLIDGGASWVTGSQYIKFARGGGVTWTIGQNDDSTNNFYFARSDDFGSPKLTIADSGYVGIATTTPAVPLSVVGNAEFTGTVSVATPTQNSHAATKAYVDSTISNGSSTSSFATLSVSGTSTLATSGGMVGIGTTSPSDKLSVNGFINTLGAYQPATDTVIGYLYGQAAGRGANSSFGGIKIITDAVSWYKGRLGFFTNNIDGTNPAQLPTEKMTITASGNVGIGTTAPYEPLHIHQTTSDSDSTLKITRDDEAATDSYASIGFTDSSSGGAAAGLVYTTTNSTYTGFSGNLAGGDQLEISGANGLLFNTASSGWKTRMKILANGYVGIATTTPAVPLSVAGNAAFTGTVSVATPTANEHAATKAYVDSTISNGSSTGSFATLSVTGTSTLATTGGNVGIGTTSPTGKLHVAGDGTVAGHLQLGDDSNNGILNVKNSLFVNIDSNNNQTDRVFEVATNRVNYTGGSSLFKIQENGYVGIGTATPGAKLHVYSGDSVASSTLRIGSWSSLYYTDIISDANGSGSTIINNKGATTANQFTRFQFNGLEKVTFRGDGNVGIATTTPAVSLSVAGEAAFTGTVTVATPTSAYHAATKNYVDSVISTGSSTGAFATLTVYGNWSLGGAAQANLNMNSNNIVGVNKLTVATIDPLYDIGGKKYSTYASAIAGGVKEEFVSRGVLTPDTHSKFEIQNSKLYSYLIDFNKISVGSDLWVWYNAVDFSKNNVEVLATAYGIPVPIAYEIEDNKIIFNTDLKNISYDIPDDGIEFSYRLVGKRFDWKLWPTYAKDQSEKASLKVR